MTLVHSLHQLCTGLESQHVNRRELKKYILVKGRWKELHPLNVKIVMIKTPKRIPSSFRDLEPLQGIYDTKGPVMTNGLWMTNRHRSPLN
jgi:hypothetical protein